MSERGNFRGGRGSSRGGDQRGGGRGGRGGSNNQAAEKPKKENILDLTKYMDKQISVKFNGGREGLSTFFHSKSKIDMEMHGGGKVPWTMVGAGTFRDVGLTSWKPVVGTLKGYDQLMNLVLDDVQETLRGLTLSY